jgi:hypothetical protein
MTTPAISQRQAIAAQSYARQWRAVNESERSPLRRLHAQDDLRAARAVLTDQEVAILDLCAGRGRRIGEVAQAAGRPVAVMAELFLTASTKLADHYEARPGDVG